MNRRVIFVFVNRPSSFAVVNAMPEGQAIAYVMRVSCSIAHSRSCKLELARSLRPCGGKEEGSALATGYKILLEASGEPPFKTWRA